MIAVSDEYYIELPKTDLLKRREFSNFEEEVENIPARPGVYAIWKGEELLYVGMAGTKWTRKKIYSDDGHLRSRLKQHAAARRSDNLVYYLIQGHVGRALTESDWRDIDDEENVTLQTKVKEYMWKNLSFSYAQSPKERSTLAKRRIARDWEKRLLKGELDGKEPRYNKSKK